MFFNKEHLRTRNSGVKNQREGWKIKWDKTSEMEKREEETGKLEDRPGAPVSEPSWGPCDHRAEEIKLRVQGPDSWQHRMKGSTPSGAQNNGRKQTHLISIILKFQNLGNQGEDPKSFKRKKKKVRNSFSEHSGSKEAMLSNSEGKNVSHLRVLHPDQLSIGCK